MLTFDATSETWKKEHSFAHLKKPHLGGHKLTTEIVRFVPIALGHTQLVCLWMEILRASPPMHSTTDFGWGKTFIMSICKKKTILNQHFHSFATLVIIGQID
jgi:hypothetical protein